jgi:aspartate/methionine/tyrosine aminotransferase
MLKIQQHSVTCATSFVQKAAVTALAEADPDVAALVATFKARRARLCEGLAGLPGLEVLQPEGTFYLFLDVSGLGAPSATVAAELLDREGLAVTPGSAFGEAGEGYLRISFAAAESAIDECCRRLGRYVRGRAGR